MKKLILILLAILPNITSFGRSINDVKQILVGEWYEENTTNADWIKYNSNGTGSFMASFFLFEDSFCDFSWYLSDENTLIYVRPNNEVSRESISIIDNNTIRLNGQKYIRRGSKPKTSSNSNQRPTQSRQATQNNSKPIVCEYINNSDELKNFIYHPLKFPNNYKESTGDEFIEYCKNKGFKYTDKKVSNNFRSIKMQNVVSNIFGVNFYSELNESQNFVVENGEYVRMSGDWTSEVYSTNASAQDAYNKFINNIIQNGGVFQEEVNKKKVYLFPNNVRICVALYDNYMIIHLLDMK